MKDYFKNKQYLKFYFNIIDNLFILEYVEYVQMKKYKQMFVLQVILKVILHFTCKKKSFLNVFQILYF